MVYDIKYNESINYISDNNIDIKLIPMIAQEAEFTDTVLIDVANKIIDKHNKSIEISM